MSPSPAASALRRRSLPRLFSTPLALLTVALCVLILADMLAISGPAAAQQGFGNFFTYQPQRPRRAIKRKRLEQPETAAKAAAKPDANKGAEKTGPTQPVYIVVSLGDQHATIYDANGVVTRTRVSTGQPGHRTPTGVFSVIGKERWHRSNIYSGAPMPWMQRITWSGVAMHAGVVPGYPASHGCIRLPAGFAPQLYGMTRMGARVVVTPRDVQPVAFSHPLLPLPKMFVAPPMPSAASQQASKSGTVELASIDTAAVPAGDAGGSASTSLLDPISYAAALKKRAAADKANADLAAKNALAAAQAAGAEARQAAEDVARAEAALDAANAKLAAMEAPATVPAEQQASASPADVSAPSREAQMAAAESEIATAQSALTEARERETAKRSAAFAAVESWKSAVAAADKAASLVDEADRRREQVSVFISKKEGRIFIRQDWKDVWEAPVTIRDPDRPLGTHVYTAIAVSPDGSSMRWSAISMPPQAASIDKRRGRDKGKADAPVEPAPAPETAAGALDRIELPEGARERIAELLWTGGSIIVSDEPRSYEMSDNETDFIVLTR